ncbi:AtzH-like domain-containing protein [Streptomyces cavernae]|uniref:AtzH-like domain-containing protein n=1 Tax=Streptomyces cavernae TaxID=2259034 RepID=UPI00192E56BA|nr:AtzH-like domain-containing protein [Streptomyces cavernae]
MIVNDPATVAETRAAFERCEKALVSHDVAVRDELFRDHGSTVRFRAAEELFGFTVTRPFGALRAPKGLPRELGHTEIVTFGDSLAVVGTTRT